MQSQDLLPEVKALSLDLWGTLIRSHPDFKPARTRMLGQAFGIDSARDAQADAAFRSADRQADDDAERLGADVGFVPRVLAMHASAVAAGLSSAPAPDAASLAALEAVQSEHVTRFPPQPFSDAVPDLLLALGDLLPLAVTSNTGMLGGATMRRALAANGLLPAFRVLVFSNECGAAKPSPAIFSATVGALAAVAPQQLGNPAADHPLTPAQILHVGDNPLADIAGAKTSGLAAAHVNVEGATHIDQLLSAVLTQARARLGARA